MESTAVTARGNKGMGRGRLLRVSVWVVRSRGEGKVRRCFYSLLPAARGGQRDVASHLSFSRCRLVSVWVAPGWWTCRVQSCSSSNLVGRGGGAGGPRRPPPPHTQGVIGSHNRPSALPPESVPLRGEAARCRRIALCKTPLSQHWTGAEHPQKAV
jgi:hypothetical protein